MKKRKWDKQTPSNKERQRSRRDASEHPWRNQNCRTKKMTFATLEEARLYIKGNKRELVAYRCPHCGGIHLGSPMAFDFYTGAVTYLTIAGRNPDDYEIYQCQSKACGGKWHYRVREAV